MKLLTWNIQWGRGMDGRVDLARIAAEIRAMGPFDVICLQEVAVNFPGLPGSRGEDGMAVLAAHLPGYTPVYAPATDLPDRSWPQEPPSRMKTDSTAMNGSLSPDPSPKGGGELRDAAHLYSDGQGGRRLFGNALFSRLPVGQVWRHLLPWPSDPTVPSMQRVLLEAVIEAPFGPVRVLTTHLEYYSRPQRLAQIDAIRRLHAEACAHALNPRMGKGEEGGSFEVLPRPASALLCGDMNFTAHAEERARLLAPLQAGTPAFLDSWQVLHGDAPHAPTVGIHPVDFVDRPECFDFWFLTEDLAPRLREHGVNAATEASDHQPVWVELDAG